MRKPAFCIFLWPLCSDIIFMKFDAEKIFFYKIGSFVNLDIFPTYIK